MDVLLTSYGPSKCMSSFGRLGKASGEKRGMLLVEKREGGVALAGDLRVGAGGESDERGRDGERVTET